MTGVGCAMKIFFFFLFNLVMLGFIYDDLPSFYLSCVMWWDHLFLLFLFVVCCLWKGPSLIYFYQG